MGMLAARLEIVNDRIMVAFDANNNIIGLYNGSVLDLASIKVIGYANQQIIGVYESDLNVSDSTFNDGGQRSGIAIYDRYDGTHPSNVNLTNVSLKSFSWYAVVSYGTSYVNIEKSNIEDNFYGVAVNSRYQNGAIRIKDSTIKGNEYGTGFYLSSASPTYVFDARNNWWGDASGPYEANANSSGHGDIVDDYLNTTLYSPWLASPLERLRL